MVLCTSLSFPVTCYWTSVISLVQAMPGCSVLSYDKSRLFKYVYGTTKEQNTTTITGKNIFKNSYVKAE